MPWNRNDPDPLEAMRRKLAQQERLLAQQVARLNDELHPDGKSSPPEIKPSEPPVWRLEDDVHATRNFESMTGRRRPLARQSQRDMVLFFIALGVLILVMAIFIWVAYDRNATSSTGP